jgi:integrase
MADDEIDAGDWSSGNVGRTMGGRRTANFGVNPSRLQAWLGHSTINTTMRYVHHVEEHHRPIPVGSIWVLR